MRLRYGDAIRLISHQTGQTLTSVSVRLGRQKNWISIKLGTRGIKLDSAIRIAEAFGYEVVLHPASQPLGERDIALERGDADCDTDTSE